MGSAQVNKFFAVLNAPLIYEHTYKRHDRIVGLDIEKVAKESCQMLVSCLHHGQHDVNMIMYFSQIKR